MINLQNFLKYIKNLGFQSLPVYNCGRYVFKEDVYKLDFQFQLDIEKEIDPIDDLYIYGWVIEFKLKMITTNIKNDKDHWFNHFNHKIYNSKESALDSINQSGGSSLYFYRVKPMYAFKNNGWRNYIINKIIKEEKQ